MPAVHVIGRLASSIDDWRSNFKSQLRHRTLRLVRTGEAVKFHMLAFEIDGVDFEDSLSAIALWNGDETFIASP